MADSAVMRPTDLSSPNAEACVEQGLPLDLLCLIFAALDVRSLGRCRQTCRAWRDVIAQFENSIMRSILRRDFGIVCPRDMSPFLAYRTQDSLRKGRGRSRFLIDSDPFVEYLEDDDSSAAGTSLPSERDSDELVEGGGEVAPNHSWGLKRGVENSGSSRSSSRERTIKRPRRFSTAVPGPAGCLDEHVGLPTSDSLRSSWVSRVWNKRRAFAAWPADPGDAYMLVLEMDFLFLLDPSRPNYISVFDLRDNYGTFPDLALDPEAAAFAEGQRKMLSPIATLPNPAPLPNTNPGFGTNAAMIGLILGNGKGSCVTFDEASQICVWDAKRNPEPEFTLRLVCAAGPALGQAIFSMNVHDNFIVTAGRYGQVVVFDMNNGDVLYSFELPRSYRSPNAPFLGLPEQLAQANEQQGQNPPPPPFGDLMQDEVLDAGEDAVVGDEEEEDGVVQEVADQEIVVLPAGQPVQAEAPQPDLVVGEEAQQPQHNLMNVAMYGNQIAVAVFDGTWWIWEMPNNFAQLGNEQPEAKRGDATAIVRRGISRKVLPSPQAVPAPEVEFPAELPVLKSWTDDEHGQVAIHAHYAPETLAYNSHVLITNGPDRDSIALWDLSHVRDSEEKELKRLGVSSQDTKRLRCTRLSVSDVIEDCVDEEIASGFAQEVRFAEISMISPEHPTIVASLRGRRDPLSNEVTHGLAVWDFGVPEMQKKNTAVKWQKIGLVADPDGAADVFFAWVAYNCEAVDVDV